VALGSSHPLTEMSTMNLLGRKGWPASEADNLTPIVSRLSRKCGNLDVSQPYGPSRPVTGIALPFLSPFYYLLFGTLISDFDLTIYTFAGFPYAFSFYAVYCHLYTNFSFVLSRFLNKHSVPNIFFPENSVVYVNRPLS
jgi:hypothetical protein